MPLVPILRPAKASAEGRQVYEEFHRRMQFPSPPNFIMTQGHWPTIARAPWEAVCNILVIGEIPRWMKEMVFVAISRGRECGYCEAAHIACCRMLGVIPGLLKSLVKDVETLQDAKVRVSRAPPGPPALARASEAPTPRVCVFARGGFHG